ncbi:MAG: hypothetical protein WD341_08905 [Tistlia sp.]|uniref:hypothetical protein n=1 Tax=Tistlia sp. TaxID=3057121 RepID=UPI0034A5D3B5
MDNAFLAVGGVLFFVGMPAALLAALFMKGRRRQALKVAVGCAVLGLVGFGVGGNAEPAPEVSPSVVETAAHEPAPMEPEVVEEVQAAEAEATCRADLQCWGDKHSYKATVACEPAVERLAQYTSRWVDGFLETKFSHFRWLDKEHGTVTYLGDRIEYQNGFGAWQAHVYECDYHPEAEAVLTVRTQPGRL